MRSLLQRYRKWWKEHPANSDNWDLERWKLEFTRFHAVTYLYAIIFAIIYFVDATSYRVSIPSILPLLFVFLFSFMGLIEIRYIREIGKLKEAEA